MTGFSPFPAECISLIGSKVHIFRQKRKAASNHPKAMEGMGI